MAHDEQCTPEALWDPLTAFITDQEVGLFGDIDVTLDELEADGDRDNGYRAKDQVRVE